MNDENEFIKNDECVLAYRIIYKYIKHRVLLMRLS
jgi:hypothetical protein